MKPIKYDRHAKRRMRDRDIKEQEVELTIKEAEFIELSIKDRINAYKSIGNRFLRVTYKEEELQFLVITATVRKKPFKKVNQ